MDLWAETEQCFSTESRLSQGLQWGVAHLPAATKWARHYWPMLAHWPLLSWLPSDYKTQMKFLGTTAFGGPGWKAEDAGAFPLLTCLWEYLLVLPCKPLLTTMWNTWIKDFVSVIGHDLPVYQALKLWFSQIRTYPYTWSFLINDIHLFPQSLTEEALPTGNSFKNSPVYVMVRAFPQA